MPLTFDLLHTDVHSQARLGQLHTPHGTFDTPVFMPIGTQATVKTLRTSDLLTCGARIILCNSYHLFLRPGHDLVRSFGGLHTFMGWPSPILTDSGGFQVFSLGTLARVSEEGVRFQSHLDGARHMITPERAIDIQMALGSDIMMVLDECTPYPATYDSARLSMEMTCRWARRCQEAGQGRRGGLFAIVQGSTYKSLRDNCVATLLVLAWRAARAPSSEQDECDRLSLTFALAAGFVLTPILWLHYLVLLVVPIALARPRLSALWFVPLALTLFEALDWYRGWPRGDGPALVSVTLVVALVFVGSLWSRGRRSGTRRGAPARA
jgi:hypothetical protein